MDDTLDFNGAFGPFADVLSHARGGLGRSIALLIQN